MGWSEQRLAQELAVEGQLLGPGQHYTALGAWCNNPYAYKPYRNADKSNVR